MDKFENHNYSKFDVNLGGGSSVIYNQKLTSQVYWLSKLFRNNLQFKSDSVIDFGYHLEISSIHKREWKWLAYINVVIIKPL